MHVKINWPGAERYHLVPERYHLWGWVSPVLLNTIWVIFDSPVLHLRWNDTVGWGEKQGTSFLVATRDYEFTGSFSFFLNVFLKNKLHFKFKCFGSCIGQSIPAKQSQQTGNFIYTSQSQYKGLRIRSDNVSSSPRVGEYQYPTSCSHQRGKIHPSSIFLFCWSPRQLNEAHPPWKGQSALLSPPIQILFSSGNTHRPT